MENKTIKYILSGVVAIIFILAFFFTARMISNGKPDAYDPDQMGLEMLANGEATPANYEQKGKEAFELVNTKIEGNILAGVSFMKYVFYFAAILMIGFLIYGLIMTLTTDFKKGVPSLIFSGIALLAFIWAYFNSGSDTTGFDSLVSKNGIQAAESMMSETNFWVNGLLFVLVPGVIILVLDLLWGIIRSYIK